jgi:hypothetical protein
MGETRHKQSEAGAARSSYDNWRSLTNIKAKDKKRRTGRSGNVAVFDATLSLPDSQTGRYATAALCAILRCPLLLIYAKLLFGAIGFLKPLHPAVSFRRFDR